jgi:hypothetical protein
MRSCVNASATAGMRKRFLNKRNHSIARPIRSEVELDLLMRLRVLFSPEFQQKWRHEGESGLGPVNLRVATGTKRQHEIQHRLARLSMVHDDGSFISAGGITDATTVAITLQNQFPQPSKGLFILSLEGVTGCTHSEGQHLRIAARATHNPLARSLHSPKNSFAKATRDSGIVAEL